MFKGTLTEDQKYGRNPFLGGNTDAQERSLAPSIAKKKRTAVMYAVRLANKKGDVYTDEERASINRALLDGEFPGLHEKYGIVSSSSIGEEFAMTETELRHYPRIDKFANELVSDLSSPEIEAAIKDTSAQGATIRETMKMEAVKQKFNQAFIEPVVQAVSMNPQATEEDIQQAREQAMQAMPTDVYEGMDSVETPSEMIAKVIVENAIDNSEIVKARNRAAEDYVAIGQMYLRPILSAGKLHVIRYAPEDCKWSAKPGVRDVKYANWFCAKEKITFADLVRDHGDQIKRGDIKKLYQRITGNHSGSDAMSQNNTTGIDVVSVNEQMADIYRKAIVDNPNGGTMTVSVDNPLHPQHGEAYGSSVHVSEEDGYATTALIERTYVTWVWESKAWKIKRRRPDGIEYYCYRSEYYTPTAINGDLTKQMVYIPEVWEATLIGAYGTSADPNQVISVDVRPVDFQYSSKDDIYSPTLPVYGGITAGGISPIDRGFNAQLDYNYLRRDLNDKNRTNYGNLALIDETLRPEQFERGAWLSDLVRNGFGLKQPRDINPGSPERSQENLNLSRNEEIISLMNQMQLIEADIRQSMYYSSVRSGETSQYATEKSISINAQNSDKALGRFYAQFAESIQDCVVRLHALGRQQCINNATVRESLFGPYLAEYVIKSEKYSKPSYNISLVDTRSEKQKIEIVRNVAMQAAGATQDFESIVAISMANSRGEIENILANATRKSMEQRAQEASANREQTEKMIESQMQKFREQVESNERIARERNAANIESSEIRASVMERASDVNKDGINDLNTRTIIQEDEKTKRLLMTQKHEKEMSEQSLRRSEREKTRDR